MRLVSLRVYLLLLVTAATSLHGAATALIPQTAPVGARVLIAGNELANARVSFTTQSGSTEARVVLREATFIEVAVPAAAASGPVRVYNTTGTLGSFAFTLVPRNYTRVRTLAGSKNADEFKSLYSLTVAPNGNIYVADAAHHQIRVVTPNGATSVLAGSGKPGFEDGVGIGASFKTPRGVAFDALTNILYVADTGNHALRRISSDGVVTTVVGNGTSGDRDGFAGLLKEPSGIAVDQNGHVIVADTGNHKIKLYANGVTTTVAGSVGGFSDGPAANAQFQFPQGIAVLDARIYVADTHNHRIRVIQNGVVGTVAGTGTPGFSDGTLALASFNQPTGIAVTDAADLFIADAMNHRIRRIAADVTTVAGNGNPGLVDGLTTLAQFKQPAGINVAGLVLVADTLNDSVRVIDEELTASGLYPRVGPEAGGNEVRIYGTGFVPGQTTVFVNDARVPTTVFTSTSLSVVMPPGTGAATLKIETSGRTATLVDSYTYVPKPTITVVAPAKGRAAGGQIATITGTDFHADSVVRFGNATATITSNAPAELTVTTPAGSGSVAVEVTTPGGTASRANAYTYLLPPVVASVSPDRGTVGTTVVIAGEHFDVDSGGTNVRFGNEVATIQEITHSRIVTTVPTTATTAPITVTTAGGDAVSAPFTVSRYTALRLDPPQLTLRPGAGGGMRAIATDGRGETDVTSSVTWRSSDSAIVAVDGGSLSAITVGSSTIYATFLDLSAQGAVTVTNGDVLPPDPATTATPISPLVPTTVGDSTAFLYSGPNPVQFDVAPGAIDRSRAAVLRGRVLDVAQHPLAGARVEVHRNGQYGWTLSRADGYYDIAVNGGGSVTLSFKKAGFFDAHRSLEVLQNDFTSPDDVILVAQDTAVTTVDLSRTTLQVARGSVVSDAQGSRQATLLFRPGTAATMRLADGTTRALTSLQVRATEYTVGASGPEAMPASLPQQSGYTYCVELSVDEAVAAGAASVEFTKPVILYVENFLGFPIGGAVPAGYYDRQRAQWIAAPNGRVIKILEINNGVPAVDVNGDGLAELDSTLDLHGIDAAERQQLATMYAAGQSLWRVPVPHFTPWDCNWPYGPPPGAKAPKRAKPRASKQVEGPYCVQGSIIDCNNQSLGEVMPITGTPFTLRYQSLRMPGDRSAYQMEFDLSGETLPPDVKRIDVEFMLAGKNHTLSFAPQTNLRHTFVWDGRDVYGRLVQGSWSISGRTGYVYQAIYQQPAQLERSFAMLSGVPITGSRERTEITLWQEWRSQIGAYTHWDPRAQGFGGWSIAAHHVYDVSKDVIYFGDGGVRNINGVIETVAGNGSRSASGDGGSAVAAAIGTVGDVALAPDGTYFITDISNMLIRRVSRDGIISTYAGTPGVYQFAGDGGPASKAAFYPASIELMADGSLLVADPVNRRIRKIAPDGIISTFAGNGTSGTAGDGGLATAAQFVGPMFVATGPDGSVYVGDRGYPAWNVRRISPDGRISTIAGNGSHVSDEIPASSFRKFSSIGGLTVDRGGSVYVGENYYPSTQRVWRIGTDGIIRRFAGVGAAGYAGDGGLAIDAQLNGPVDIDTDAAGNIYILEAHNDTVRRVTSDGIITTIAGSGTADDYAGDAGPATAAKLHQPAGLAVGLDGSLLIADTYNFRVRRVSAPALTMQNGELLVPSADGAEAYVFDASGRHLATKDTLTGASLLTFGYTGNELTSIIDVNGNVTTITRSGSSVSIVAPGGRPTTLTLSEEGYLASIANAAGETTRFTYAAGGLLTAMETPKRHTYRFTYDAVGLLTRDEDPAGGFKELSSTETADSKSVVVRTAEGRTASYVAATSAVDTKTVSMTGADGIMRLRSTDMKQTTVNSDSSLGTITVTRTPDVRFGMQAPLTNSIVRLPSGLTASATHSRSVVLSSELDPLSVTSLTDTVTLNGRAFSTTYDAKERSIRSTTPSGRQIVSLTDAAGRLVASEVPEFAKVGFTYDSSGRLTTITSGDRKTTFSYSDNGELSSVTDALSHSMRFEYDGAGRVTSQTLPDGRKVSFTYDPEGNLSSIAPPGKPAHEFTFTPAGLLARYGAPQSDTTFAYNKDRDLTAITRPDGMVVRLSYDPAGRLAAVSAPGGSVQYGYNATTGALTTVTPSSGVALSYSSDGPLLTSVSWNGVVTGSVAYTYNSDFRVVNENGVTFAYDADGLLSTAGALTLSRSAASGMLTGAALGSVRDTYAYNDQGEVTKYVAMYGSTPLLTIDYVRDSGGRIRTKTETEGSSIGAPTAYEYDAAGRLARTAIGSNPAAEYSYDSNGNRTKHQWLGGTNTGTYDEEDRLLTYGGATYTYTPNGELESKTLLGSTTTYEYDSLGNLRKVVLPGERIVEYIVDGQDRRVGRKVNGVLTQGFLYGDQLRVVAELDGTNAVISQFIYGTRSNVPDYMTKGGVAYRIISDHLGSPRLVVNASDGTVIQRIEYDEFGNVSSDSNPGFQPFGFSGALYDTDTRLVRMGVRDYDPHVGRFISKDPIGFAGGDTNLYAYVLNDPINLIDPMGTDWVDTTASFSAGLGDALLLGFGDEMRDWTQEQLGWTSGSVVDECSTAYRAGGWTSFALGAGRMGYAATAKGISLMARSGAAASAGREQLKTIFRFGIGKNWRPPNLAGKTDEMLRRSAGRTNPYVNAYGAGVAAGGAIGGSGCGCP